MSSINFCSPVVFDKAGKTLPQRALEAVDDYFTLGTEPRVLIFEPDDTHSQPWAQQDYRNRHRSWTDTALKVLSYCTLALPLLAFLLKMALRCYLRISSIKVEDTLPNSKMEAILPMQTLQHIGSFLNYKDQGQLAQAGIFANQAAHDTHDYYVNQMTGLKTEIHALPPGPLAPEHAQRLLVGLIKSDAIGHPKHWIPVMEALMKHLVVSNSSPDSTIQSNARIADLLATSAQPISPNQIYKFCTYLGQNPLSRLMQPWVGYRVLEHYMEKLTSPDSVRQSLREYLIQQAKIQLQPHNYGIHYDGGVLIRSLVWFGVGGQNGSLWRDRDQMPDLLLEVLWTHIQSLHNSDPEFVFVSMDDRFDAELPHNFTLELAKRIMNAGIRLYRLT